MNYDQIITAQGARFVTNTNAHSSLIKKINGRGDSEMQTLRIIGIDGNHEEFKTIYTDLIVEDEFGERHVVCEDFIWSI